MTLIWLLVTLLAGLAPATPATPEATSTLTIRHWVCPVAYEGIDFAAACQEPIADMPFDLIGPVNRTLQTDEAGTAAFTNLPSGRYEITGGPPGEFVQNAIACHSPDLDRLPIPFLPRTNQTIAVNLHHINITCDWYSIPEDLRGDA